MITTIKEFTNENVMLKRPKGNQFDVTKSEKSIASQLEPLFKQMDSMDFETLKNKFKSILEDPTTHASEQTRKKWLDTLKTINGKNRLMQVLGNLYLAGANMKVESIETSIGDFKLAEQFFKDKNGTLRHEEGTTYSVSFYDTINVDIIKEYLDSVNQIMVENEFFLEDEVPSNFDDEDRLSEQVWFFNMIKTNSPTNENINEQNITNIIIRQQGQYIGEIKINDDNTFVTKGQIGYNNYNNFIDLLQSLQGHDINIDELRFE